VSERSKSEAPAAVDNARSRRDIYFEESARDAIDEHVGGDTSVERGGVLVGSIDEQNGRVTVSAAIPAYRATSAVASLTFTHEAWDDVNEILADRYDGLRMVGWYHSHPRFGIFLSEWDLFIQSNFFAAPWQVAYVVDPVLGKSGFFGWENGNVVRYPVWTIIARGSAKSVRDPIRESPAAGDDLPLPPPPPPFAEWSGMDKSAVRPRHGRTVTSSTRQWIVGGGALFVVAALAVAALLYFRPTAKSPVVDRSRTNVGHHQASVVGANNKVSIDVETSRSFKIQPERGRSPTGLTESWRWTTIPGGRIDTVVISFNGISGTGDASNRMGVVTNCAPSGLLPVVVVGGALQFQGIADVNHLATCNLAAPNSRGGTGLIPNSMVEFLFFEPSGTTTKSVAPRGTRYLFIPGAANIGVPPVSPAAIQVTPATKS
jgi:proteasome lid subunit RPN8/RPN11